MAAVGIMQRKGLAGLLNLGAIVVSGEGLRNERGWFRCLTYVREQVLDVDRCLLWLMTLNG